jgi:hypothetical protein
MMKAVDIPLVRGGKLTEEMIAWVNRVSEHFPGVEMELITIRKPISAIPRGRDRVVKARGSKRKR